MTTERDDPVYRLALDLADWLQAAADDLESEVIGRYGATYDELHPAMKRRFTHDMFTVVQSRALLRHVRDVIPEWPRPPESPPNFNVEPTAA